MKFVQRGYGLVELMIVSTIVLIFGAAVLVPFINPPSKTEANAYEAADKFILANQLKVKRKTCGHDSDNDGQATCTIALEDSEKIYLSCPVGIVNRWMGAESCKEVSEVMMMNFKRQGN